MHLSFHFFLIFLDWPLDHHVMSFLISVNSVYFGVHFSDVSMIPNLYFDFFVHGVSFFIPSLSACACLWVWSESPIAAYIWVLFLYQFIYYVFKCCFCCSVPKSCLPSTAVCKAFLFFTITQSLFKLTSTESMMASNHLILSYPACPQCFPASWSFPASWFFASSGQNIGASTSLSMNIQGWLPLGLTGLISLQSKGLSRVFPIAHLKASILQHSAFFMVQIPHLYMTTRKP